MRDNETTNFNYIINNKENNNKINKINVELTYLENEEKIEKNMKSLLNVFLKVMNYQN